MAILFPTAEAAVVARLSTLLASTEYAGAVVSTDYDPSPVAMVWVSRNGGPSLDVIRDQARIAVNVFHKGPEAACDALAAVVGALLRASPDGAPIVRVQQFSGPTRVPDTFPRRLSTFDVVTRGSDLT